MRVTRDVVQDLIPVFLEGEASADTVRLVEEFLRHDPELALKVEQMRGSTLPEVPAGLHPTKEKESLDMTKQLMRWRGVMMFFAIFLTMLPMSIVETGRFSWRFLRDMPSAITVLVWLGAVACWGVYFYVRRRLRSTGLY
jgi:hypothetical protein